MASEFVYAFSVQCGGHEVQDGGFVENLFLWDICDWHTYGRAVFSTWESVQEIGGYFCGEYSGDFFLWD